VVKEFRCGGGGGVLRVAILPEKAIPVICNLGLPVDAPISQPKNGSIVLVDDNVKCIMAKKREIRTYSTVQAT